MGMIHRVRLDCRCWRAVFIGLLAALVTGCAGSGKPGISRIALLAPFEGRYREVGYNAYYAALLAFEEGASSPIELLAVDDGGSPASAADRARALAHDPLVAGVIALGDAATSDSAQAAYGRLPTLIVGYWSTSPMTDTAYVMSHPDITNTITTLPGVSITHLGDLRSGVIGGDVFALEGFRRVNDDWRNMVIVSSGRPADMNFRDRYAALGQFVPEPGLLATLTYDAVRFMIEAAQSGSTADYLASSSYEGINGTLRFEDRYWADAPLHRYRYEPECGAPGVQVCFIPVPG
jgi:ABC-type branched-subunit amino acid transport system substrate-binding protein